MSNFGSTSPIQNSTLPFQRPSVYLQPPNAYRPWHTIRLSDLQILPPLPQPAGWTSQCPGCYPVYASQRCPAAKAPMAIWSSYRDRRLTWAYRSVGPVGVSSMDDYSLPLTLASHLLIAPLGVDSKFAVLNKFKKNFDSTTVFSHPGRTVISINCRSSSYKHLRLKPIKKLV